MKKRVGFLFGLLAGGVAAFLAFKRLNPAKREALINKVDNQANHLKSRAVDYAFYANGAFDDAYHQLHHHTGSVMKQINSGASQLKSHIHSHHPRQRFHTAASHLSSVLSPTKHKNHDIVVNANDALPVKHQTIVFYPNGNFKPF